MNNNMEKKVENFRIELIKILRENEGNRDNVILRLEEFGISDRKMIEELLSAFDWKYTAHEIKKGTYAAYARSTSGVSYDNDIDKAEAEVERCDARFNYISSRLAYIKLAQEIDMSEVDEDFLNNLSGHNIQEKDIRNPGLKLTYSYFLKNNQSQEKLAQKEAEVSSLRNGLELSVQQNEELTGKLDRLSGAYTALQKAFGKRINDCESKYQSALGVISSLREKLRETQNHGFFRSIISKLMPKKALSEGEIEQVPDTLKTKAEKLAPSTLPGQSIETILRTPEETQRLDYYANLRKTNPNKYYQERQTMLIGDDSFIDGLEESLDMYDREHDNDSDVMEL